mgnify:FL=1
MYAYSKEMGTLIDLVGAAISNRFQEIPVYPDDAVEGTPPIRIDQQYVDTQVIGFGFGSSLPLANLQTEDLARALVEDIASCIKKGDDFYDVRQRVEQIVNKSR